VQITAAVHRHADQPPALEQLVLDDPRAGEVLVRIVACGICHTDLIAPRYLPLPAVMGHEGAGIVEATGPGVSKVKPGDRVVLTFPSCGNCGCCLDAEPGYCAESQSLWYSGRRADGTPTLTGSDGPVHGAFFQQSSFATYALATERNIVKAPADLPLEMLGPFGCAVQTGAGAVLNTFRAGAGSRLAVFGAGGVGLSAIMAARIAGAGTIVAIDTNPERLELARRLGATHTVDARDGDVARRVEGAAGGGVQFSLETSASVDGFQAALDCLAKRGVCGIVAVPQLGAPFSFAPRALLGGRSIVGIVEGDSVPDLFLPRLFDWYRAGRLPVELISESFDFGRVADALRASQEGRVVKPILRMA